ncbi:MAG TPA: DUF2188 domain-containing protein [Saprospiraceae bacterium]|nr:DUF2188 domain-containing protein [Saprospiraceae bacterium]MCB9268539.1 DUF2188 domain-containing protein [Lewinellaceae bacterium]HPG07698.1 DUF2188 domain-containing protein [Saprospiraceae bacterium]HPR01949.1 DUF2188 domain-containing protein [Saprospiraceae bacterium]HQU53624.1 DUF2188 domain-containing protein [Saprospiraceae bacterium]
MQTGKPTNHVVPSAEGWAVVKSGASLVSGKFPRKEDAIRYGRELSRKEQTELYIHKKDGTIQNRNSYGNDPFPPADRVK